MKLVIAIPSRGLIHSRTMEAALDNVKATGFRMRDLGQAWDLCIPEPKPIPESHNQVVEKALELKPEFVWLLEEDMGPDRCFLNSCLALIENRDMLVGNYKLEGGTQSLYFGEDGKVLYGGVGCCFIRASVFDRIEKPWFSDQHSHKLYSDRLRITGSRQQGYGHQDIHFFYLLQEAGISAYVVPYAQVMHWRVKELGKPRTNDGCHVIEAL